MSASRCKASEGVDAAWPVTSRTAEFKGEILVGDSQVNHGGAYMSLLQSSAWTAIFRVERLQPQDVCAVARRIQ